MGETIFRNLRREAWIITARTQHRRGGLLATWVTPISLPGQPAALMTAIAPHHFTAELMDASGSFAAHLLRPDQTELAWQFALASGRDQDKLSNCPFHVEETGSPVLDDCRAWLDCRVFARLETGDRIFYWADVVAAGTHGEGPALDDHALFAAANEQQLAQVGANLHADVSQLEPRRASWRAAIPDWMQWKAKEG
jgi:flavin reductase (DIM6/NTAB) family NADH-FMN oxidoreductase RutF